MREKEPEMEMDKVGHFPKINISRTGEGANGYMKDTDIGGRVDQHVN